MVLAVEPFWVKSNYPNSIRYRKVDVVNEKDCVQKKEVFLFFFPCEE